MPTIRIEHDDLLRRVNDATKIILPLATDRKSVMPIAVPFHSYFAVGAYQGGPRTLPPELWRVACQKGVSANYYELWSEYGKKGKYYLHSVCLNLYRIEQGNQKPLLMIHADPETQFGSPHDIYKKGPHIHVMEGSIWPDVHIGLNLGHLREVVSAAKPLTIALMKAVKMVEDQVFPLL
jgi:hypothetical protein